MSSIAKAVLLGECGVTPHSVVAAPVGGGGYGVAVWCTEHPSACGEKTLVASCPNKSIATVVAHAVAEAAGDLPVTIL